MIVLYTLKKKKHFVSYYWHLLLIGVWCGVCALLQALTEKILYTDHELEIAIIGVLVIKILLSISLLAFLIRSMPDVVDDIKAKSNDLWLRESTLPTKISKNVFFLFCALSRTAIVSISFERLVLWFSLPVSISICLSKRSIFIYLYHISYIYIFPSKLWSPVVLHTQRDNEKIRN